MLKLPTLSSALLGLLAAGIPAQQSEFHPPVRLVGGGQLVKVEAPGYAAPGWADLDADGDKDLIVGQFAGGRLRIYLNRGDSDGRGRPNLGKGAWLEVDGKVAEVPGVW